MVRCNSCRLDDLRAGIKQYVRNILPAYLQKIPDTFGARGCGPEKLKLFANLGVASSKVMVADARNDMSRAAGEVFIFALGRSRHEAHRSRDGLVGTGSDSSLPTPSRSPSRTVVLRAAERVPGTGQHHEPISPRVHAQELSP
jgi:hypothetical protein